MFFNLSSQNTNYNVHVIRYYSSVILQIKKMLWKLFVPNKKKEGMALKKILLCLFHERKHKLTLLTAVLLTTKTQNPPLPIKKRGRTAIKAFSRLGRVLIYFEQQPIKHAEILIMIFSTVHKKKAILKLSQKLPFFLLILKNCWLLCVSKTEC